MIEWGTFPDWLVAIGTIGAFGTGGWVLMREVGRDHERSRRDRRAQASQVAAWGERTRPPGHLDKMTSLADGVPQIRVTAMNGSALPIYNVVAQMEVGFDRDLTNVDLGLVAGRDSRSEIVAETDDYAFSAPAAIEVSFTDAAGVRWRRDNEGALEEAPLTTIVENVILRSSTRRRIPDEELGFVTRSIRNSWDQRRARRKLDH